jgi:hypothetical protein
MASEQWLANMDITGHVQSVHWTCSMSAQNCYVSSNGYIWNWELHIAPWLAKCVGVELKEDLC